MHHWDLVRKLVETEHAPVGYKSADKEELVKAEKFAKEIDLGLRGTDSAKYAVHNFEDRSDKYVIPSNELFLGPLPIRCPQQARTHHVECRSRHWAISKSV